MAKKKAMKKKPVRNKTKVVKKKLFVKKAVQIPQKKALNIKMRMALANLLSFIILFVFSLLLYSVSNKEFYLNLFLMLSMIFGFLSVAFLIAYLIFVFRKIMKK